MESLMAKKKKTDLIMSMIEIIIKILKSKVQGLGLEKFSQKRMEKS